MKISFEVVSVNEIVIILPNIISKSSCFNYSIAGFFIMDKIFIKQAKN